MKTQDMNVAKVAIPPARGRGWSIRWPMLNQVIIVIVLSMLVLLTLVPIIFMVVSSLKNNSQILSSFWALPSPALWENYSNGFEKIWRYMFNTVLYAVSASVFVMALSAVAGYIFAKKSFPGKEILFLLMLAMMMIPSVLTLIPAYVLYENLGLTNTPWAILIASAAGGQVFGTFLCRSSMAGIPDEMFEASRMDGASELTVFLRMVIPLSLPILATLFIMHSVGVYNDYVWPLLTIRDNSIQVISVGLTTVFSKFGMVEMGPQFAAYAISSIPLILTFTFGMKYYVQGMTQGALKM
ncbi:carbohydrate ABC transporter permease [Cohnella sp. WQ 127256]|uniref:carbohydrate ABC transporter permease n=1 Tax=Cohnella sp. WQ 127256 TaxID=2938790 RepID=UPI002118C671|nr:carbohydrate ABC transporter permease [Cohnella sp. WQ 127256]